MTPLFRDFLQGLAGAVAVVGIVLLLLVLGGCASGVQMTDEEAIACRNEGCAVFTEDELQTLVNKALGMGYRKGWGDAIHQTAKDL